MGINPTSRDVAGPYGSPAGGGPASSDACRAAAGTSASSLASAGERQHHLTACARSSVVLPGRRLIRWWRRRRTYPWAGPCRDATRRRGVIIVSPAGDGRLALVVPGDGVAVLDLLVIGQLREALRLAAFELHRPAEDSPRFEVPSDRASA